jgi:hypothetical protein
VKDVDLLLEVEVAHLLGQELGDQ